jgi:tRNA-dihydrouridine synthase
VREIKDAHDLAKVWSDGSLINEKALDDPNVLKKLEEIFKGTPYEVEDK